MNQTISGTVLLAAVVLCVLVLFVIGFIKKPKVASAKKGSKPSKLGKGRNATDTAKPKFNSKPGAFSGKPNRQISKLKERISKHFPDFTAIARENHLILERNARKVAMLTLDTNAALGRRRLGDVAVINFHQLPSVEELRIELSGV